MGTRLRHDIHGVGSLDRYSIERGARHVRDPIAGDELKVASIELHHKVERPVAVHVLDGSEIPPALMEPDGCAFEQQRRHIDARHVE